MHYLATTLLTKVLHIFNAVCNNITYIIILILIKFFKAWKIFGETIEEKEPKFYGLKCENSENFDSGLCCTRKNLEVVVMGEPTLNTTRGTYFLVTNRQSPLVKPIKESVNCEWVAEPVN